MVLVELLLMACLAIGMDGEPIQLLWWKDYLEIVTSGTITYDRLQRTEIIMYVVEYTGNNGSFYCICFIFSIGHTVSTDPAQKADVVAGLLSKELIAYQFYKGSIQSVNDRLAWLASRRGNPKKSKQGFKFKFNDPVLDQLLNSSPERLRGL